VIKDCRVFASTSADGYLFARLEQLILDDGLVDFSLEAVEKALLTDRLLVFGTLDHSAIGGAHFAQGLRHCCYNSFIELK